MNTEDGQGEDVRQEEADYRRELDELKQKLDSNQRVIEDQKYHLERIAQERDALAWEKVRLGEAYEDMKLQVRAVLEAAIALEEAWVYNGKMYHNINDWDEECQERVNAARAALHNAAEGKGTLNRKCAGCGWTAGHDRRCAVAGDDIEKRKDVIASHCGVPLCGGADAGCGCWCKGCVAVRNF